MTPLSFLREVAAHAAWGWIGALAVLILVTEYAVR